MFDLTGGDNMAIPSYFNYNGPPLNPAPPNLPTAAPADYNQQHENQILNVLRLYFNQLNNFTQAVAIPLYGTTSTRPIVSLQTGQFYFDTTLGYPIWWSGSKWVNASGTAV
jgi:hypothetical protein